MQEHGLFAEGRALGTVLIDPLQGEIGQGEIDLSIAGLTYSGVLELRCEVRIGRAAPLRLDGRGARIARGHPAAQREEILEGQVGRATPRRGGFDQLAGG